MMTQTCDGEKFQPQCQPNEVIVTNLAQYGRMELGRCIETDVLLGCSANALELVDRQCSGLPTCELLVDDSNILFIDINQCPKDIIAYLDVEYTCLSGKFSINAYLF